MKSVVVEIQNGFAAVLMEDGNIRKLKDSNFKIGQVIEMKENKTKVTGKLIAIAASIAVFLVAAGILTGTYLSPYTYVSLDVNPSIVFTVNQYDRVIHVEAINDDGSVILSELDIKSIKYKNIEDAILDTITQITSDGYFSGTGAVSGSAYGIVSGSAYVVSGSVYNAVSGSAYQTVSGSVFRIQGGLVITIANKASNMGDADQLAEAIQAAVKGFVQDDVVVEVDSVGYDRVQEARELGTTPGKLNLVEKLKASTEDSETYDTEEWLHRSVRDIMTEIQVNDAASRAEDKAANAQDKADEKAEGAQAKSDEAQAKADEKAANAQAKSDEAQAKADEKAADAQAKSDEAQAKADEKAADAQAKSDEAQAKADEKAADAQAKSDEAQVKADDKAADAQAKSDEAQAKADEKAADAQAKADEAKAKADDKAADAEAKADDKNQGNGQSKNSEVTVTPSVTPSVTPVPTDDSENSDGMTIQEGTNNSGENNDSDNDSGSSDNSGSKTNNGKGSGSGNGGN